MRSHIDTRLGFAVVGAMALCGCNTNPWDKTGPSITAPTISAVSPSIGSTEGGTYVTVDGDQLKPGFTATLDGVPLTEPLASTRIPDGSTPPITLQEVAPEPPDAFNTVWKYC